MWSLSPEWSAGAGRGMRAGLGSSHCPVERVLGLGLAAAHARTAVVVGRELHRDGGPVPPAVHGAGGGRRRRHRIRNRRREAEVVDVGALAVQGARVGRGPERDPHLGLPEERPASQVELGGPPLARRGAAPLVREGVAGPVRRVAAEEGAGRVRGARREGGFGRVVPELEAERGRRRGAQVEWPVDHQITVC